MNLADVYFEFDALVKSLEYSTESIPKKAARRAWYTM
jgi:hypothetical protein